MVRYIQITQVPPERLALWRSWLSPQRRKRAGRMLDDRETVCGEGLARELLAAALHCPPEEAPLRYDAQGKPLTDGLYLSISHSRGLAACAVADRPVGLDVELVRPAPRGYGSIFPRRSDPMPPTMRRSSGCGPPRRRC